jgi:hypothetical protein
LTSFAANPQVTLSQVAASARAGTSAEATMIASARETRITVAGLSQRAGLFGL